MIKVVIIDDENNVRIVLKKLLSLIHSDYQIVGEAPSVSEAKTIIEKTNPDIVLLDIELEDGTGFDLLKQLPEINFKLIFITAFNEHAIKAFKFNALDYLLKPIDPEELKIAMVKALEVINNDNNLKSLLQNFEDNKKTITKKLVIKTTEETHFIPINEIFYFQSDGSYSKIFSENLTLLASKNLKHFQEMLPIEQFIRTHQSYLVNRNQINSIKNNHIILKNNAEIPISTRKKPEILALLK